MALLVQSMATQKPLPSATKTVGTKKVSKIFIWSSFFREKFESLLQLNAKIQLYLFDKPNNIPNQSLLDSHLKLEQRKYSNFNWLCLIITLNWMHFTLSHVNLDCKFSYISNSLSHCYNRIWACSFLVRLGR